MRNKIHAKSCTVKLIKPKIADKFISANHKQGLAQTIGQRYDFGLFYHDQILVGEATFCTPRIKSKRDKYQYELLRMTFKKGVTVYEGASKLIHYYEDVVKPESFFTYQARTKNSTSVYSKAGMTLVLREKSKPILVKNGYTYEMALDEHQKDGTKYLYLTPQLVNLGPDKVLGTHFGEKLNAFGERYTNAYLFTKYCGYHTENVLGDRVYEWIRPFTLSKQVYNQNVFLDSDAQYEQARILYLKGNNGIQIKQATGISIRSLINSLKKRDIKYTVEDIQNYQIQYIRANYDRNAIVRAYKIIHAKFDDLRQARRKHQIHVLGCTFGPYANVFKALLGETDYNALKNGEWKRKQTATMFEKYGKNNYFEKHIDDQKHARDKRNFEYFVRRKTLLTHLGDKQFNDRRNQRTRETWLRKYGVTNPLKIKKVALAAAKKRMASMREKYGVSNSVEDPVIRNKIFNARTRNHTLNSSLPEDTLYKLLVDHFGKDNVVRQYYDKDRYPFHVDFYIKSRDLFIELNGDRGHMNHWYDENNVTDVQQLLKWSNGLKARNRDSKLTSRYAKYIKMWTVTDLEKRNCAKQHKLNYLVFWDGRCTTRNGHKIARLQDARTWFKHDCPDSKNWYKKNTY